VIRGVGRSEGRGEEKKEKEKNGLVYNHVICTKSSLYLLSAPL